MPIPVHSTSLSIEQYPPTRSSAKSPIHYFHRTQNSYVIHTGTHLPKIGTWITCTQPPSSPPSPQRSPRLPSNLFSAPPLLRILHIPRRLDLRNKLQNHIDNPNDTHHSAGNVIVPVLRQDDGADEDVDYSIPPW